MQGGPTHEEAMAALFAEDAVYVEPFSAMGQMTSHTGRAAVRAALRAALATPLPEQRIVVDRVDVDGDVLVATWTCHSPALPGGSGRGTNTFTFRGGLIARLETRFLS
jgi:ketosteroid isomerase-like protein